MQILHTQKKKEKRFNMEDPPVHDTPSLDTGLSSFLYSYSFVFSQVGLFVGSLRWTEVWGGANNVKDGWSSRGESLLPG